MQKLLIVDIQPSRIMLGYLITLHCLCILVLYQFLPTQSSVITGLCVLVLLINFSYRWRLNYKLVSAHSIRKAFIHDDKCILVRADGSKIKAEMHGRHYVNSLLVIVDLKISDSKFRKKLVLFKDAVSADQLRCLRVRLRFPINGEKYNSPGLRSY